MTKLNKKVILIGATSAGKTTICQYLNDDALIYNKTQAVEIIGGVLLDTPGEFAERRSRFGMLQVTAADADVILFVKDPTEVGTVLPPVFSSMFAKPVVGVITKKDLADEEMIREAKYFLSEAGAKNVFVVCSITGEGFDDVINYINSL